MDNFLEWCAIALGLFVWIFFAVVIGLILLPIIQFILFL
jgi:hypothetical protein